MSYVALVTDRFDEVALFYGTLLGFPVAEEWDRDNARGRRFELGGLRLEILDNSRERKRLSLGEPADRFHVVVEVEDIEAARNGIAIVAPPTQDTVRCQSFSERLRVFVTEALARFLFQFRRQRLDAATGVY